MKISLSNQIRVQIIRKPSLSSLKTVGESILSLVNRVGNSPSKEFASSNIQLLMPMEDWDWNPTEIGVTSREQYQFCDRMPQSCEPHAQFASSSKSFSDNYRTFLELFDPNFKPESLLRDAKSKIRPPEENPSSSISPVGWTKVPDGSGIYRWQPDWIVSSTPNDWIAKVVTSGGNGGTIELNTIFSTGSEQGLKFRTDDKNWQSIAPEPDRIQSIKIYAPAWDRIPIYPGAWYNSSLISFGNERQRSLLCCRISELVVAYKPKLMMDVDDSFVTQYQAQLSRATELELLGFVFKKLASELIDKLVDLKKTVTGGTYSVQSASPAPVIVGVILEKIN
jgi:hypothetical protein